MVEAVEKRKLIAVVEDDPHLADLFYNVLEYLGPWKIQIFPDGQSAKDHLPEIDAQLIFLDIGLPILDGVSLYKMLRGHSSTKDIPVVFITGSYEWELHRMGLQTGLLLRKPFNVQELLSIVRALLPEEREG